MTRTTNVLAGTAAAALLSLTGCAGSPAAPFDTLKSSNLTAYRLQNFEPQPTAAVPGAAAPGGAGVIPGLPPEIQSWVQQGASGFQQLIPPGLLPPGMLGQGGQPAPGATPAPAADSTPRFHGFRILSQTQVIDPDLKEELGKILGKEKNFDEKHANCMYAEMGLSFTSGMGPAPNDVLISYSCNQVAARNFAWPHPQTGLKPGTLEDLSKVVQQIWPPGT
jgi:hypothetical protein